MPAFRGRRSSAFPSAASSGTVHRAQGSRRGTAAAASPTRTSSNRGGSGSSSGGTRGRASACRSLLPPDTGSGRRSERGRIPSGSPAALARTMTGARRSEPRRPQRRLTQSRAAPTAIVPDERRISTRIQCPPRALKGGSNACASNSRGHRRAGPRRRRGVRHGELPATCSSCHQVALACTRWRRRRLASPRSSVSAGPALISITT